MRLLITAALVTTLLASLGLAQECEEEAPEERIARAMKFISTDWRDGRVASFEENFYAVKIDPAEESDEYVNLIEIRLPNKKGKIRVRIEECKDRWKDAELDAEYGIRHISIVPRLVPRWAQLKSDVKWESEPTPRGFHWWAGIGQDGDRLNHAQVIATGHRNETYEFACGGFGWKF